MQWHDHTVASAKWPSTFLLSRDQILHCTYESAKTADTLFSEVEEGAKEVFIGDLPQLHNSTEAMRAAHFSDRGLMAYLNGGGWLIVPSE